jgi:hypothetical protein
MDEGERRPRAKNASRPAKGRAPADPAIGAAIGRQLKSLYDGVLTEPVPDVLSELVKRLAGQERGRKP